MRWRGKKMTQVTDDPDDEATLGRQLNDTIDDGQITALLMPIRRILTSS